MKILLIGPQFHGMNQSIENSIKSLGHECKVIDIYSEGVDIEYVLKKRLGCSLIQYFNKRKSANCETILNVYKKWKPDYVLIIKGDFLSEDALRYISKETCLALWMMDSYKLYPTLIPHTKHFNRIYVFEGDDLKIPNVPFQKTTLLNVGFDETIYFPMNESKDIDISFAGNLFPERCKVLDQIIADFPELNIQIYGRYASIFRPLKYAKFLLSKRKYYKNKIVSPKQLNVIYNKSKICLNIHHDQSKNGWNPRLNDILGSGAFQLVNKNEAISREFYGCLAMYDNYDDLKNKIMFYLSNAKERESISKRGYSYVINQHTWKKKLQTILDDITH